MSHLLAPTARPLLALALAATGVLAAAAPAAADPSVSVTNDRGRSAADLTYRTSFTVRGSGFQSVQGGFGGVYLAFGWVSDPGGGSWKPSRGGTSGDDYRYVPDSETGSNAGYLRFVAFPGSSTANEAHAVMGSSGSFEVDLVVPGPVFESLDRDGNATSVDCREVTCGVITFGAHGVRNARNESFTPVAFEDVYDAAPGDEAAADDPGGGDTDSAGTPDDPQAAAGGDGRGQEKGGKQKGGAVRVAVDKRTAQAGHAMAFTARGFTPGEQVVAVLDDGVVSLGPLTAGTGGEVAGVLPLPDDIGAGTHELRVSGAASEVSARERFPVAGSAAPTTTEAPEPQAAGWSLGPVPLSLLFVLLATAVLLAVTGWRVRRHLRGRRTRRARAQAATEPAAVTA
ncbi:hypothetical protein [uncultured Nocardioides sp.]|uniref:hypothetical protein n=1 Tax=uncultured Nocardioides sp. TaxID=198441 RepID=UPI0026288A30|nr:hypothetical protein [uncultured Nocardioides sp.]